MTAIAHDLDFARQATATGTDSSAARWTGRILSGITIAFLTFDGVIKLLPLKIVSETMTQLGYPTNLSVGIGLTLLACLVLYIVPRTALLGALLLTGYLGGAVATHVRVGNPLFSHVLFPVYVGAMAWGGLVLRDARLRALISR